MTPEPRPSWVSICTTAGLSALATATTGSSPEPCTSGVVGWLLDWVEEVGVPETAAVLSESLFRRPPPTKPAVSSATAATTATTTIQPLLRVLDESSCGVAGGGVGGTLAPPQYEPLGGPSGGLPAEPANGGLANGAAEGCAGAV